MNTVGVFSRDPFNTFTVFDKKWFFPLVNLRITAVGRSSGIFLSHFTDEDTILSEVGV